MGVLSDLVSLDLKKYLFFNFVLWLGLAHGQIPTDNLYIHLSFDNTYQDLSGSGNTPNPNGTTFTENRYGCENSACYFNGSATLTFPNQARFKPLISNSVSFWLKTSQTSRFDLIVQRTGSNSVDVDNCTHIFNHPTYGNEWSYPHYNNLNTAIRNIPINGFNNNEWHHFVYVKDVSQNKMKVYYDGNLISSKTINDVSFIVNGTLTIGKWVNYFFTGAIDDFRVYNKALNSYEIQALYNECLGSCLEIDLGSDTSFCEVFSHTLFAGDQYPNYLWSTGETTQSITVYSSGIYWVKGFFDNGCSFVDSIEIGLFSASSINLGGDINLCYGETKKLSCGDCFKSYLWNTGDTTSSIIINESGYYWVKAINADNDTISDDITVTVLPKIQFSLGEDRYLCAPNNVIVLAAEEGFENYLWNMGSVSNSIIVGEGEYWVKVTDQNGCFALDTITVSQYSDLIYFKLYPNPASDYFYIEIETHCFPENPILVEVVDMNQRTILSQEISEKKTIIKIPYEIKEAPYIVKLFDGKNQIVKKLIVKKSLY